MHLRNILDRFKSCPDTEPEQSVIRVVLILSIFIYLYLVGSYRVPAEYTFLLFSWAFLFHSLAVITWIFIDPKKSVVR